VADRLRPVLVGRRVVRFEAARLAGGPRPRPGELVAEVVARGKHLLVRFERGVVLQTHLRMTGSWHIYRSGERWGRAAHLARAVIEVEDGWLAVCFAAPVVRTFFESPPPEASTAASAAPPTGASAAPSTMTFSRLSPVGHLGPDLCDEEPDVAEVIRRAGGVDPATVVCDLLLDQRVAAGIGNVYKSEVLWACRLHPLAPAGALGADLVGQLYRTAHRFLRANLGDGPRTTNGGAPGGLAAYGRRGRPCLRCGSPIERRELGLLPRSTYWCPRCQPAPHRPPGIPPAPAPRSVD
jgi:endonuclease-8